LPKYREVSHPRYYDNPIRRWDSKMKTRKYAYFSQDPLYFNHASKHTNGGIQVYIDHCHDQRRYNVPLNKMAYILYNMAVADIFDPLVYEKFESHYSTTSNKHMSGRFAFGALWAYYKSNQGSLYGVDFWTSVLQDHVSDMRVHEVTRLLEAFSENR